MNPARNLFASAKRRVGIPYSLHLFRFCLLALWSMSAIGQTANPAVIHIPAGYRYGAQAPELANALSATAKSYVSPHSAADGTDPFIAAKAAALGNDPAQIFAFVRDQVGIDPYVGSLRGAHGTLSGMAGNALDRASLTIALLRASGLSARYAQGTLAYVDAQKIIARAFDDPQRIVGCNNTGGISDARNDSTLINEALAHFWVEYQPVASNSWTALDPAFGNAAIGQAFAAATGNFTDVPEAQQHKVRVRVTTETYSQAGALYGFGLANSTVLDQTFDSVDLVDKPITVGHFVSRQAPQGLTFGAVINTYSPYVTVGDSATAVDDYQVVRGSDYSETFTSFPLGTVLITGVFVDVDVISPSSPGNPQTFRRVLVDRIGYATRQSGGSVNTPRPTDPPALTSLDLMTIQASPSLQPLDAFAARQTRLTQLRAQLAPLVVQVNALPPPQQQTIDQIALRTIANNLNRDVTIATLELMTSAYAGYADRSVIDIGATYLVKPWITTPRLTIAHANVDNAGFHLNLDIRKNDLRVYSLPGISYNNVAFFERARGIAESVLEGQVFANVSGLPSRSIVSIFQSSSDLVSITRYNPAAVDQLNLSADAKARIRDTVAGGNGRSVIAPRSPVSVNGASYNVWLETDPYTGATISTGEDGTHQAIGEYGGLLLDLLGVDSLETQMAKFIGQVESLGVSGIAFTAAVLDAISSGKPFTDLAAQIKQTLNTGPLQDILNFLEQSGASEYCTGGCGLIQNMLSGLLDGIKAFKDAIGAGDPPVPSIVMAPPLPLLPAPIAPGSSPGFTMNLVRDTRYFVPYNGAEVPTVFLAKITNTGPATDTFRLNNAGVDAPFSIVTGVSQITLAPGASGEVGVCLIPYAALPPSGTATGFHLRVTTPTTGIDQTIDGSQTTPNASALLMQIQPDNTSAKAGDSISATLTFNSLGNAATAANLASMLPPGMTMSGVPSSVNLAAGETRSIPITIGIGGSVASGSTLTAQVNGEFGATAPARALFTTNITSILTTCVADAAIKATELGRTTLGATLVRLAGAMDVLAGNPSNGDDRASVLVELDDLIHTQFNAPYLSSYVPPVTAERATLATATAGAINTSLTAINTTLCSLADALRASATDQIGLGLVPVQSIATRTQTTTVRVNLNNATPLPRVFDIAISGVPPQVTAALTSTTVTLPAQSQTNGCCGLPSLIITFTNTDGQARAFDYILTATPHDNPSLTQHVTGNFVLANDVIHVASVTASPVDADAGTPVQVTIKLMNSLNARRQVFAFWTVRDETNTTRRSGQTDPVTLAPGDGIVTLTPFPIDTTGLAGAYAIEADVVDVTACCNTLPGSVGYGSFLIGQPFSAVLNATPSNVPLGNSTLNYSLVLSHESAPTPVIDPRSSLAMATSTRSFVRNGNYLYVCESDRIAIVDTTNPDALTVAATFATDLLGITYLNVNCNLDGNTLVLAYDLQSPSSFDNLKIVAYDIGGAHATAPVQLNATPIQIAKRFGGSIAFNGTHQGSLVTAAVIYNPFSGFIFEQNGNLISLDFTTPSAPVQTGELYHHFNNDPPTDSNDPIYGGPSIISAGLPRGNYTLLATTTAVGDGFGTGPGVGRIATVDTNQLPTNCPGAPNPCTVHATDIPEATVLFGVAAQGNAGVAVGDTLGAYDGYSGSIGNLAVSALDLTSATNPVVQSTLKTLMLDRRPPGAPCNLPFNTGGTSLNALTNNYYAVGAFNPLSCSWVLAIIDANDTAHLRIIPYDVTSNLRQTILQGDKLYALTDTDILVYDYATLAGPSITATVDIPKGTGVTIAANSFSVAPTSIDTSAPDHDRYFWYRPTASSITWQGQVANMRPGEIRTIANGGTVTYTLPSIGSGSMALNEVNVSTAQTMSITPAIQNAAIGDPATYTITIANPTAASVNYALSVSGISPDWVKHLDTPLAVPANGQATSTLILQTTPSDPQYTAFPFTVNGAASSGFSTSASAVLNTQNQNIGGDPIVPVYASSLVALNATITAGRGDVATNTLHANNLGSGLQGYGIGLSSSGGNITSQYLPGGFTLDAGTGTDVLVTVLVRPDTAPGTYPLATFINSYGPLVTATFNVVVPNQGVQIGLSPSSGTPGTVFSLVVHNSGVLADTFDLSGLGPLGPAVMIAPSSVTLDPGTSTNVIVTLGNAGFVPQGTSSFDVQAVSRSENAARARASAQIVSAARKSVALAGEPPSMSVASVPATRSFGLAVQNTGNVEDAYSLAIVAKSVNMSASLRDAGGGAVQSVAPVRLPGNAFALAHVDATINSGSSGTVTLRVTSQTDATISATTVLTIVKNGAANIVLGTPGDLEFGDQALTTTSDAHSIVLTNTGLGTFTIGSITLTGTNTSDFALASGANPCAVGGTIAANGGACTLYVRFTPHALGSRSATVSVSDIGATTTIPVSLHGNGVDTSGHLTAEILPNRNFVQFGRALSYLVSARNPSSTPTTGVSINTMLPPEVDATSATWICINAPDANSACTPNGIGPLSDTNMRVPANGSVSYLMTVLVKAATPSESILSTATVSSSADPGPYSSTSAPTQIVIYRDSFEPFGDGASSPNTLDDSLDASPPTSSMLDERHDVFFDPPATSGAGLIDILLVARGGGGSGFRIERLDFGTMAWIRAVVFDHVGRERCSDWIIATPGELIALAIIDTADTASLRLQDGTAETSIVLSGAIDEGYLLRMRGTQNGTP